MVTLDDVRQAVMAKINTFKDPEERIYGEEIAQGFSSPCYYVKVLRANHNQQLGTRYRRRHMFVVRYFPELDNRINQQLLIIADRLYEQLEYITVNGRLTRGIEMHHEVVDRVLHFFVRYDFNVRKPEPELEHMEHLYQKGELKGE